jgi:hypothetical protein
MLEDNFTPKSSGMYRRCSQMKASSIWGWTALVIVFLVLVLMLVLMPPLS